MAISIRPAKKQDLKAWAAMRARLWPDADAKELRAELPALLRKPRFRAWLALEGGLPVAFAEAYIREFANGCDSQPVAFLEGIWVEKGHRRKGVGKCLVAALEAWAAGRGLKELGSDAELENRLSHRSHKGWGFEETERVVYFRKKLR